MRHFCCHVFMRVLRGLEGLIVKSLNEERDVASERRDKGISASRITRFVVPPYPTSWVKQVGIGLEH